MSEMEQGSPEWHAARLGKVTASRIADVMARTKSGWGASRNNYMSELLIERLTGIPAPTFINDAMRWGTEKEPEARAAYEFRRDVDIGLIGFVDHPKIKNSGASPDGLIRTEGLVEFKCPQTATHLETLLGGALADKYIKQTQWQMACAKRAWCDWVSFDPRVPEAMQIFIQRVERDDKLIAEIEKCVTEFLAELDDKEQRLREKYERPVENILMAG